jgi:hypothetical protein
MNKKTQKQMTIQLANYEHIKFIINVFNVLLAKQA